MFFWQMLQRNCDEEIDTLCTKRRCLINAPFITFQYLPTKEAEQFGSVHESFPMMGKESVMVKFSLVTFWKLWSCGVPGEDRALEDCLSGDTAAGSCGGSVLCCC
ncbi:hypothetical protein CDAR_567371 [Caerostris darwini]|uniref:Uncharacterized protein n=1 Tax=Caerostris darwini TaxID=1538125 RepID=A0AAV4QXL2_9ARAC|nr:hypothetical protein CDAR_567371 [Caerostris darwini]